MSGAAVRDYDASTAWRSTGRNRRTLGGDLRFLAAALLTAMLASPSFAASTAVRVVSVADGDTLTVRFEDEQRVRVRLQGIDAPERGEAYSQVSRRNLHTLTMGKFVTFDTEKIDRHGRTVAVVRVEGNDVCLAQIEAGLAWHFKKYEREQTPNDRAAYAAAEAIAKAARRGLWRDDVPLPPWEFRARNRIDELMP